MASVLRCSRLRLGAQARRHACFQTSRVYSVCSARYADARPPVQSSAATFKEKGGDQRPLNERMSLEGKTTVITGGARGIGLTLVEAAAEAGSNVVVLDVLEELLKDFSRLGVQAQYYRYILLPIYVNLDY